MTCPSLIGWYRSCFSRLNKRCHVPLLRVNLHIAVPPLLPLASAAASSNRVLKMSGGDGDMVIIAEKDDNPGTEDLVSEDPKEISEGVCEAVEYIRNYLNVCKSKDEADDREDLEQLEELHHLLTRYLKSMGEIKDTVGEEVDKLNRDLTQHIEESSTTSSSEAAPFDKIQRQIDEKLVLSKEIGQGSERHLELSDQEIQNLIPSDHCQNIVRYHGVEHDTDFVYPAMVRCDCSLDDLIQMSYAEYFDQNVSNDIRYNTGSVALYDDRLENQKNIIGNVTLYKENDGRPSPLLLKLMRDIVSEIGHLHDLHMVHGDLKPQNISIIKENSTLCAKISDMGASKQLLEDKSSQSNRFSGWKAPEQLLHGQQTSAMDLFSLGCILFFCITGGRHPFGDHERDEDIRRNNKPDLLLIEDIPEAFHLISSLLEADPKIRPTAIEVLHHPLFWDAEKRLSFLCDTNYRLRENSNLFRAIERTAYRALGTKSKGQRTWRNSIDMRIIMYMGEKLKTDYKFSSVRDLLRLIRNMLVHYGELPEDIRMLVGPPYEGFDDYFTSRFPMLVIEVYKVVCTYCREEGSSGDISRGFCS